MSVAAIARPRRIEALRLWPLLGLALAAGIAWLQPYDFAFAAITFGRPPLRAAAIVLMALSGAAIGRRVGLSIEGPGRGQPARDAILAAIAMAVFCAACDWLWRPILHPGYVGFLDDTPLAIRIMAYGLRAMNESIIYRLFLGSLLIWILGCFWKAPDGAPAQAACWTAFAVTQTANVWINVTSQAPLTAGSVLHDLFRYVAPGLVWSWLYWRRGFAANEIAAISVHFFFQPLVVLGL